LNQIFFFDNAGMAGVAPNTKSKLLVCSDFNGKIWYSGSLLLDLSQIIKQLIFLISNLTTYFIQKFIQNIIFIVVWFIKKISLK